MGLKHRVRSALGSLRAGREVYRRLFVLGEEAAADRALLAELNQRTLALMHQVEHIESLLSQVDPVAMAEMTAGVRDSVRELSIELTEQANETAELLAGISTERP